MSPACIAQLLGFAMSFSRSPFAHAATGAAATTATVNARCNHALPTLFIRPPPVNRRNRTTGPQSFVPPLNKVNLSRTNFFLATDRAFDAAPQQVVHEHAIDRAS